MQDKEKIVINDHIQGEPLSEENLDKTLNFLHKIRLSMPEKTIWIYSRYTWEEIFNRFKYSESDLRHCFPSTKIRWNNIKKRREILSMCNILIDGRYIDSQRNISAKWKGSDNQRVIDVQKSLKEDKVVLYCE